MGADRSVLAQKQVLTMWLATHRVSILRGTITDQFGDEKDRNDPVHSHVPASIRTVRNAITTIAEGRPQQVATLVGRVPAGTDIQPQDRLQDERTGVIYIVDGIDLDATSPVMDNGIRLDLRRVT